MGIAASKDRDNIETIKKKKKGGLSVNKDSDSGESDSYGS